MKYGKRMASVLAIIVVAAGAWYGWLAATAPIYDSTKTVSYSFTLKNTGNRLLENAEFWTYAPVRQTSGQACCQRLDVSHPYQLETDDLGNQVLHFKFEKLPPFAVRMVRITAQLQMAEKPNWSFGFKPKRFLSEEPLMESRHEAIRAAAANLSTDALLQTTRKTYDWVVGNVRDSGYLREERGALYALQNQQGDCTESAYLFTALARANAIPARAVAGYVLENNGLLRAAEYHEWSEFYDAGTWRIADPQKRSYDQHYDHYVAMRLVDNRPDAVFKFARYRYAGQGLEVEME